MNASRAVALITSIEAGIERINHEHLAVPEPDHAFTVSIGIAREELVDEVLTDYVAGVRWMLENGDYRRARQAAR